MHALKSNRAAIILSLALLTILANSSQTAAQEKPDYFAVVRQRLVTDGFSPDAVAQLYGRPEVFLEADGVSRFFVHSEAKLNYDQFTTPESIQKARAYMREYRVSLESAEKTYGVDPRVITAILLKLLAPDQVVHGLERDVAGQALAAGRPQGLYQAPGWIVGAANVAHFACPHQVVQPAQHLGQPGRGAQGRHRARPPAAAGVGGCRPAPQPAAIDPALALPPG